MTPLKCFHLDHGYSSLTSSPCCQVEIPDNRSSSGNIIDSFSTLHKNKHYIEIKQSMDQGIWHDLCNTCRVVEAQKSDTLSYRQHSLHKYHKPAYNVNDGLIDIQLAPGYLCNIQCRSCTPALSSSWINESRDMPATLAAPGTQHHAMKNDIKFSTIKVLPSPVYDYTKDDWSSVKYASFVGGEPIYNPEFYVQLKKLFTETNGLAVISFATNGTIALDLTKHPWIADFKNIQVNFSIDSIGSSAEFIRTGTVWSKVEKNIQFYKSMNIDTAYHMTNSVLNILETNRTIDYLESMNIRSSKLVTHVIDPVYLNYSVLTENEKLKIVEQIRGTNADYIISALADCEHNPDNRSKFFLFMEHTKNYHGMDWKDYLPDLYNIMNEA